MASAIALREFLLLVDADRDENFINEIEAILKLNDVARWVLCGLR